MSKPETGRGSGYLRMVGNIASGMVGMVAYQGATWAHLAECACNFTDAIIAEAKRRDEEEKSPAERQMASLQQATGYNLGKP